MLKILVFLLLSLLPVNGNMRGEDKPPLRLTLREAVQLALKENPQVQIANLNVAQSAQDDAIARAALLPQAGIEVYDRIQRFNLEAFIGRSFPGSPQHAGPFQTFQAGTGFSMPVFDLTLWRRWQASRQGVRANEAQESTVREQIVLLVVSQYLGGLRATADVRAAQSRVELTQALYDQAADLQKHGVGTGLDTLRANVQLQNEKQRLIVAETQQKISLYGLVRLLNLDPHQTLELADEMSFFETPEFEAARTLEHAIFDPSRDEGAGVPRADDAFAEAGREGGAATYGEPGRLVGLPGAFRPHRHPLLPVSGDRGRSAFRRREDPC
jgi:outer membrane protein TolC